MKMMEDSGEIKTAVTRSTSDPDSVLLPKSRYERRAAALRFVAETVLSEEEEDEEEDLCADILSCFINNLEDRQWESIRERMREPLTQAHLTQVSKRIIKVVSELVFQLLVPALVVRLQAEDFSEASTGKSCKLRSQSAEETQTKDSRSSPEMLRPFTEDPLQKYFGVNDDDESLGSSASQVSARSSPEVMQQVNQGLSVPAVYTPPIESSAQVSAEQAQEQSLRSAGGALTEEASWQDIEQFLEPATEEVITTLIKSLDSCQEKTEAGVKTESTARKILQHLVIKMRHSKRTIEETKDRCLDKFDLNSLDEFGMGYCCCCWYLHEKLPSCISKVRAAFGKSQKDETPQEASPEVRDGLPLQGGAITYPMTLSSQEVVKDLSCRRFRRTSQNELREFLMRSLLKFSLQSFRLLTTHPIPYKASLDPLASEMLDTVVDSVKQLCQPQPRKFTFPWQRSENTTVFEDQVASTALMLKLNLQEKLRNFLNFYREALEKLKEGEKEIERGASILSSKSDKGAEDIQESGVMKSIHSTATSPCESSVKSMTGVVRSFLDDTEQSLKQDGSRVQSGDAALTGLEELISQDKLSTFSKMLADKLTSMFHQQQLSLTESLYGSRRAWSDSELCRPTRCRIDFIKPSEQVYLFVEEAVKRLLSSLIFPPPSWGMGHMIQVQSGASSAAKWAESVKKYEVVISVYSQLMADQVMGSISKMPAASRLQQEVGGQQSVDTKGKDTEDEGCSPDKVLEPKTKNVIIHFFQELPNNIRRRRRSLTKEGLQRTTDK
ncbi:uncharacterized protein LOC123957402 [Micropterus dolomieu]|uniref:uncharacterized protein LOC123957402 n=1 Tax=Micropterus dolomieu TaxID=147949 RepID=UPI001E8CC9B2|nr:uncharacterized protein LOC123957402 [Micropterus dolomieu]